MAITKGIIPPAPPHVAAYESYDADAQDEPLFEQLHLVGVDAWPTHITGRWRFDTCKLEQCMLTAQQLPGAAIWDSILVRCDMSGCKVYDAGLLRSEFLGCRMSGLQLGESTIKDVLFSNCKLNLANFRKCTMMKVAFENCILDDADFNYATLTDVSFINCEMNGTEFSGSKSSKVDMTNSDLRAIKGVKSLKHVRVTAEQLIDLAPLMASEIGLTIL
jgi:uncharacterized protein YjbI with pentapeptide repeats